MSNSEKIWPIEDNESALIREVYARYGLAMYMAQVLEHGMVNALLILTLLPKFSEQQKRDAWEKVVDAFSDVEFSKTFGNLLQTLNKTGKIGTEFFEALNKAKDTRNELAHRFFRDNDLAFMSRGGQEEMITRCESAISEFKLIDQQLELLCAPFRIQYGITDELLKQQYDEMLAGASSQKPPV